MRARFTLVFILLLSLLISGCSSSKTTSNFITLAMAQDKTGSYELQTDGEYIYIADINENSRKLIRKLNASVEEVLTLPEAESREWSCLEDSDIPDPSFFSSSVHSPFTYALTLKDAASYLQAMKDGGWELISKQGNNLYLDMYFTKNSKNTRIIIFENRMKVFQDVLKNCKDALTYIKEI